MSKKITMEEVEKIHNAFQSLKEALLEIEPYGIQWKALELLKEAREETGYALLFANSENPFLTNEAKNKMKMEYLEREAKKMKALEGPICPVCKNHVSTYERDKEDGLSFLGKCDNCNIYFHFTPKTREDDK